MGTINRTGDLELDQDLAFQQRMWRIQRAGWAVIALLVVAALLGLAGAGPLSQASVSDAGGSVRVAYERFWRYGKPTKIEVQFDARPDEQGFVRLWLDRRYLTRFKLDKVVPEPARVELEGDRLTWVFPVRPAAAAERQTVELHMQPDSRGVVNGRIGIPGGAEVVFRQLIYP